MPAQLSIPAALLALDSKELRIAAAAASRGAQVLTEAFEQGVEIRSKEGEAPYNLVSDADVQSEQAIAAEILKAFPTHEILGEELNDGSISAEHLWIIDPLDGTNNFAHGIPHFAISIGYYREGVCRGALVVNPMRKDWYFATETSRAYHGDTEIRVRNSENLREVMVGCGFYYDRGAMMQATLAAVESFFSKEIHGIRRFGTAALDICQVAAGQFGVFFEYKLAPWDFAAARLILERAGGKITDARGKPLKLETSSILASNAFLHQSALAITGQHHP
jgi:myo-inositol-1(or 4)-monophosphatase